jgi:hypothetical protein
MFKGYELALGTHEDQAWRHEDQARAHGLCSQCATYIDNRSHATDCNRDSPIKRCQSAEGGHDARQTGVMTICLRHPRSDIQMWSLQSSRILHRRSLYQPQRHARIVQCLMHICLREQRAAVAILRDGLRSRRLLFATDKLLNWWRRNQYEAVSSRIVNYSRKQ